MNNKGDVNNEDTNGRYANWEALIASTNASRRLIDRGGEINGKLRRRLVESIAIEDRNDAEDGNVEKFKISYIAFASLAFISETGPLRIRCIGLLDIITRFNYEYICIANYYYYLE